MSAVTITRGPRTVTVDAQFIRDRVQVNERGCWVWQGARNVKGTRAWINCGRGGEYAYRTAYRVFVGEIPDGLGINHHCDNGLCVNPDHVYAGTQKQNADDMVARGRYKQPLAGGDAHPNAHPRAVVDAVRSEYAKGELTISQVAEKFGLAFSTVEKWTGGDVRGLEPIRVRTGRFEATGQGCGTRAGYFRHRRSGERACSECLEANRLYMQAYKARRAIVRTRGAA